MGLSPALDQPWDTEPTGVRGGHGFCRSPHTPAGSGRSADVSGATPSGTRWLWQESGRLRHHPIWDTFRATLLYRGQWGRDVRLPASLDLGGCQDLGVVGSTEAHALEMPLWWRHL